jgi:hypothetical protein
MHVLTTVVALIGCITSFASATALTFKLPANEKDCFYAHVDRAERKIAFYFAVQSGGDFDSMIFGYGIEASGYNADRAKIQSTTPSSVPANCPARKRSYSAARKSAREISSSLRTASENTASASTTPSQLSTRN